MMIVTGDKENKQMLGSRFAKNKDPGVYYRAEKMTVIYSASLEQTL